MVFWCRFRWDCFALLCDEIKSILLYKYQLPDQWKDVKKKVCYHRNSSISSFPTSTDHFGRIITKADLERIQSVWMGACEMAGLTLNKAVYAEFSKRITKAKRSKGEKSKLDLSNCAINDKMLILLLETLSVGPVLAKLDLHGNDISNEGATCLVKLLNGQIQLARRFAVDERLHACFLGEVNLANNKRIDPQLLNQIADVSYSITHPPPPPAPPPPPY
eukprot:scaffold602_cov179-Ochromonas_danica.AAC.7